MKLNMMIGRAKPVLLVGLAVAALPACKKPAEVVESTKSEQSQPKAPQVLEISESTALPPITVGEPEFKLNYAPDYVGCDIPRRFFIELEVSASASELNVACDDEVEFLGRNAKVVVYEKGKKVSTNWRRYYFRTKDSRSDASYVKFSDGAGEVSVPIVIWDLEDLAVQRKVNGVPVPFSYPLERDLPFVKQRRTLTAEQKPRVLAQQKSADDLKLPEDGFLWDLLFDVGAAPRVHHFTDYVIGQEKPKGMVPPAGIDFDDMRSLRRFSLNGIPESLENPRFWEFSVADKGLKIPSNAIQDLDFSSGDFVDDGFNGVKIDGLDVHFFGMLNTVRKDRLERLVADYANKYIKTGEEAYAHKSLVALTRMAVAYNYLTTMQHFRSYSHHWNRMNMRQRLSNKHIDRHANSGIVDAIGIGESRGPIPRMVSAYDKIFDTLEGNEKILPFLRSQGFEFESIIEVKQFIERGIFLPFLQHAADGQDTVNYPETQVVVSKVVRVLDYPTTELVDLLFKGTDAPFSDYFKSSFVQTFFYKGYLSDGTKFENPGGYNHDELKAFDAVKHLQDYVSDHPEVFDSNEYSFGGQDKKLEQSLLTSVLASSTPWTRVTIGDASGFQWIGDFDLTKPKRFFGDNIGPGRILQSFHKLQRPEFAWALVHADGVKLPQNFPMSTEELQSLAAELPNDWREGVSTMTGQGLPILRQGQGEAEMALYVPSQESRGHGKMSTLNLHLDGLGGQLFSHWGYPPYEHYGEPSYYSWIGRNRGVAFPKPNEKSNMRLRGVVDLMASVPNVSVLDTVAKPYFGANHYGDTNIQRRINLLVKVDDVNSYAIDLYRITGGKRHCRSYGPTLGKLKVSGIELQANGETLAGPGVKYDAREWAKENFGPSQGNHKDFIQSGRALSLVQSPKSAKSVRGGWVAEWEISGPKCPEPNVQLRVHNLSSDGATVSRGVTKDPHDDHPYQCEQIIWDHQANGEEELRTQVVNLIEPVKAGKRFVESVRMLPVAGEDEDGFKPVGIEVKLMNGATDYFILSAAGSVKQMRLPSGDVCALDGRIAFVRRGDKAQKALFGGTKLKLAKDLFNGEHSQQSVQIKAVDVTAWTADIEGFTGDEQQLVGQHVEIRKSPEDQLWILVKKAERVGENVRLSLSSDPLVQNCVVAKVDVKNARVEVEELLLPSGFHYNGSSIVGASGRAFKVVTHHSRVALALDLASLEGINLEDEFPQGFKTQVIDFAPEDIMNIKLSHSW